MSENVVQVQRKRNNAAGDDAEEIKFDGSQVLTISPEVFYQMETNPVESYFDHADDPLVS